MCFSGQCRQICIDVLAAIEEDRVNIEEDAGAETEEKKEESQVEDKPK